MRLVDVSKFSYRIAREYMIRLEREDFENKERTEALALAASARDKTCSAEEFQGKFQYLVTELRGGI